MVAPQKKLGPEAGGAAPRELEFVTLDVFTTRRFGGNPLAVVLDADGLSDREMQAVTREFNLSETAFVLAPRDPTHAARLRIFTPGRELPFAGHPTIGATLALHALGRIGGEALLEEGVGPVRVTVRRPPPAADPPLAGFAIPGRVEVREAPLPPEELAGLLGLSPGELVRDRRGPAAVSAGVPFVVVPLRDREALARARVDPELWRRRLAGGWTSELYPIVEEAPPGEGAEGVVHARMFAPALGVPEDPATGAAAAALAGWLAAEAEGPSGTLRWSVHQGIEMGRPSVIRIEADREVAPGGAARVREIRVFGNAVPVMRGVLTV